MLDSRTGQANAGMSRRSFVIGMAAMGLAGMSAAFLSACGASPSGAASGAGAAEGASGATQADAGTLGEGAKGRILVAYFSGTGHTRRVAEEVASDLGADVFEIVPANPYTDEDLDFNNSDSRVVREYQDESQRDTELAANAPDDFDDYDTVLVGYPIWWGDSAWAMRHFASENDFSGKRVYPFCTSYSSGVGSSDTGLASLAGTGDWQPGRRFDQDVDLSEVQDWAAGLQV